MKLLTFNIGRANEEITRLEKALGLAATGIEKIKHGAFRYFNIKAAHNRIYELAGMFKGKAMPQDSLLGKAMKESSQERPERKIAQPTATLRSTPIPREPEKLYSCNRHRDCVSADSTEHCPKCGDVMKASDAKEPAPAAKPSAKAEVENWNRQLKALDSVSRTLFYRENRSAIDGAFRALEIESQQN